MLPKPQSTQEHINICNFGHTWPTWHVWSHVAATHATPPSGHIDFRCVQPPYMTCGAMRMLPPWSTKVTPVTCPIVQLTAHIRADHCRAASQLNVMRRLSRNVVLMPPQGMVCAVHTTLGRARRSFPREHVSLAFAAQHDLDAPDLLQAMRPVERTSRARLATVGVGHLAVWLRARSFRPRSSPSCRT